MHNKTHRQNLRNYWRQWFPEWDIPLGFHVHHIKPKALFKDPNDLAINHPSNLIALHPDDHYSIHKCRGDNYIKQGSILKLKNYKHSEKTKRKIGESHKGSKRTAETKARMSKAQSGKNNPMYGKKHSLEKRKEISDKQKGRYTGNDNSMFKGYYITPWGKFASIGAILDINDIVKKGTLRIWCQNSNRKITRSMIGMSKY